MKIIVTRILMLIVLLLAACSMPERNTHQDSYGEAKRLLNQEIYKDHRKTFYCGCAFSKTKKVRCNVGPGRRAKTVEWEHVVPASRFGQTFDSWQSSKTWGCQLPEFLQWLLDADCRTVSGRSNARQQSRLYRLMEADMHNLVPAIGLINQKRSNLPYGDIPGETRRFGRCDFEVSDQYAEPAPAIRGDIARIYFYMTRAYPDHVRLTAAEQEMFTQWDRQDPVDKWECLRCRRIQSAQHSRNPVVDEACRAANL